MITATIPPTITAILVAIITPLEEATTTIQPGREAMVAVILNTTTIQEVGETGFIIANQHTTRRITMETLTTMDGTERLEHSTKVTISAIKTVSSPTVLAGIHHIRKEKIVHLVQPLADRIRINEKINCKKFFNEEYSCCSFWS